MANLFDGNDLKIVQELKQELRNLKEELSGIAKQVKKTQDAFNSQSKTQDELGDKTKKLTTIQKELDKIQKRGEKVTYETVKATEQLRQKRKQLTDQVRKDSGTFKKSNGLFKSMTKSAFKLGAAFLSFRAALTVLKNGFKTIKDFEKGMSEVAAITKALPKDFKALQQNALKLGSTTSKTSLEVAGLQKEFAKLGFTTSEILAATEATIDLSIAAGSDLAESAVVAASTIRGFGLSTQETQRVVDVMAKSFTSSALDMEKFKTAMAAVAPVAKASGKTIEFTTAQLSVLSDAGLDASTSGTSLRNMFLELNKRGLTWEQGLQKINTSTNKNVTALELFGKRGATAALILADNTEKTSELEQAYINAEGAASKMADTMEDNLAGDIDKAKSAWEGFILSLNSGDGTLTKVFRGAVQFLTDMITGLQLINKSYNEIVDEVKAEKLQQSFKDDADEVAFLTERIGDYDRATELLIKQLEQLKGVDEENNQLISERITNLQKIQLERDKEIKQIEDSAKLENAAAKAAQYAAARKKANIKEGAELRKIDNENAKLEKDLRESINEEIAAIDAEWNQLRIDNNKSITDKLIEGERKFTEAFKAQADERTEKEKEEAEERKEIRREVAGAIISGASTLVSELQNLNNIEYENEIGSLERKRDAEIENAERTGASITAINTKYDRLIRKQQNEKLENEKRAAKFQAALSAATIILNALKTQPFVPLGLIMSGVAATVAGVQIAAINKQSVPKFGYGSSGPLDKDTRAKLGDRYQHEAVIMPDGNVMFSQNIPHEVLLPAGSEVLSGEQTKEFVQDRGLDNALMKQMIISQKETTKAVKKINIYNKSENKITKTSENSRITRYTK